MAFYVAVNSNINMCSSTGESITDKQKRLAAPHRVEAAGGCLQNPRITTDLLCIAGLDPLPAKSSSFQWISQLARHGVHIVCFCLSCVHRNLNMRTAL